MKYLITILFFFICTSLLATNRYVSNSGNDANAGTIGAPWQTIGKATTTAVANDSILLARSSTFFTTIVNTKTGIKFGAYGTGAQPIITGFITITGWTNEGGGIYSKVISSASLTNMVTIDNIQFAMGRTPDATYLTYQSFVGSTSITSSSLTGTPNWTGASVVIRKNDFTIERANIASQSGGTLNYVNAPTTQTGTNGYGFFIQNDLRTLTTYGEWFHDFAGTGKFYMYFGGVDPTTKVVKVATINKLVQNTQSNVTFDNITFTGCIDTLMTLGGTNDRLQNCNLSFAGNQAVLCNSAVGTVITNDTIGYCNGNGIKTDGTATITNNNIFGIGQRVGQVLGSPAGAVGTNGIYINGNSTVAQNNTIHNVGSTGIVVRYTGATTLLENFIDTAMTFFDDGGGIYVSSPNTVSGAIRTFDGNIIGNVVGNTDGTTHVGVPRSACIYLDESSTGIIVKNNTMFDNNFVGIKLHYANNNTIIDNTTYNIQYGIQFFNNGGTPITNISLRRNIFFAETSLQYVLQSYSTANDINMFGVGDSNFYCRPIADNTSFTYKNPSSGFIDKNITLAQWQTLVSPQDANSKKSPKTITNVAELHFTYNASNSPITSTFTGFIRMDVYGNLYYHAASIPAWRSLILFDNGSIVLPTANAGADQNLTLPTTSTTITGSGTGGSGSVSAYLWTQISGPNNPSLGTPNAATTTVSGLNSGSYTFRLKVTNSIGDTAVDFMQIVVNTGNIAPVADAGPDQSITLPTNTATLNGNGSHDPDGGIVAYLWSKVSGPAGGTITSPSSAVTGVTALQQGTYVYSLVVTDNNGATGTDFMQIVVNPAVVPPNQPPVAIAGPDQGITLPTSSTTVDGSASFDPDGTITGYLWRKISGPTGGAITSATSAITGITGLTAGVYIYQLRVTDNSGDTATDALQITVNAANQLPVADAGPDQSITLPTNNTTLDGSASHDPDGTITAYSWSQLSGPNTATLGTATSVTTTATGLIQGVYIFRLKVTDNAGDTAVDAIQVTVNAAPPPTPPTATASANQIITLPLDSVSVSVSTTGTIVGYQWVLFSGNGGTIESPNSATTEISGIPVGVSKYQITVTDANGLTATSIVQITVNPAPLPPGLGRLLRGYINIK